MLTSGTTFENEADGEADAYSKQQSTLNGAIAQKGSFQAVKKGDGGATFESEGK
jgi:hypothetical protein